MISTVAKISVLRLWNNKQELVLIFVVPVAFFSIFALIFSRGVGRTVKQVSVSIINDDGDELTQKIVRDLSSIPEFKLVTGVGKTAPNWPIEKLSRALIRQKNADLVIHFEQGFGAGIISDAAPPIGIYNEGSNPVGGQMVQASLAQSVATQAAEYLAMNPEKALKDPTAVRFASTGNFPIDEIQGINRPDFALQDVFSTNKHHPKVAMYAAGIAVMFLLFSSSGAGASLLEERESGTMSRLLSSKLTLTQLLAGKWIYMATLGFVQTATMFTWGQLVFDVDLIGHLPGFAIMSGVTSAAAASFALCLATVCKTRSQLNGVSIILVLSMSALGGSMIPRYVMSDSMQRLGRLTFNGWALDGYQKIFWYDMPASSVKLEVVVLLAIALTLGIVARIFAQRWSVA